MQSGDEYPSGTTQVDKLKSRYVARRQALPSNSLDPNMSIGRRVYVIAFALGVIHHTAAALWSFDIWYLLACAFYLQRGGAPWTLKDAVLTLWTKIKVRRAIKEAGLTWVKMSAVKSWHRQGKCFPRKQELQNGEFVEGVPTSLVHLLVACRPAITIIILHWSFPYFLMSFVPGLKNLSGNFLVDLAWKLNCLGHVLDAIWYFLSMYLWRGIELIIVSHAWLSEYHPDPSGEQLKELVHQLDLMIEDKRGRRLADEVFLFYDFCSLPQWNKEHPDFKKYGFKLASNHPARRTPREDKVFFAGLRVMHMLYTWAEGKVLILPKVQAGNEFAYKDRGWTCFELGISSLFGCICNIDDKETLQVLDDLGFPKRSLRDFEEVFRSKHFTQHGDKEVVRKLYTELHSMSRFMKHFTQSAKGR